jgi:putative DNA primase/helicase
MDQRLILPPPDVPMRAAPVIATKRYTRDGVLVLRHWRGGWWQWRQTHWLEREHRALRAQAYMLTEHSSWWKPNRKKIADLLEALAAVCHLDETVDQPAWIDAPDDHGVIVSCANGLLDVSTRELRPHTPEFFSQTAVPFDYNPEAAAPERWLAFLNELWPDDAESIAALQEWFGYVISGRLDLHKILLLVGPTRAGKGVIARILGALVGKDNVAGPTLNSLSGDFGLAPLLGKPLRSSPMRA